MVIRGEGALAVIFAVTRTDTGLAATTARAEAQEGGLGEYVVLWNVRRNGPSCCPSLLQTRYLVSRK